MGHPVFYVATLQVRERGRGGGSGRGREEGDGLILLEDWGSTSSAGHGGPGSGWLGVDGAAWRHRAALPLLLREMLSCCSRVRGRMRGWTLCAHAAPWDALICPASSATAQRPHSAQNGACYQEAGQHREPRPGLKPRTGKCLSGSADAQPWPTGSRPVSTISGK